MAAENRLNAKRLLPLLNLDMPGVGKVQAAVDAGDFGRAQEELLTYMRTRENVSGLLPWRGTQIPWRKRVEHTGTYASEEDLAIADDALKHLFGGHPGDHERLFPAQQFGESIDWRSQGVRDREWIWHFNMMPFWRPLVRAYWHTGNEKYAQGFFRQIDDWVVRNPPDGNVTTWRRIDAGIRTSDSWPYCYFHCLRSPSLTPRTHTHILLSLHEHAVYLHSSRFSGMNHGLFEARGLFFISVLFPEFKDGGNLMVQVMEVPGLAAHEEEGWIAVEYKVVVPRPRVRFSVKKHPVTLVTLLHPYEGEAPRAAMERVVLPEGSAKEGVFGLRIRINGKEDLFFFAPEEWEFSYRGSELKGPIAHFH